MWVEITCPSKPRAALVRYGSFLDQSPTSSISVEGFSVPFYLLYFYIY
jgi:hypothetical protein